MNLKSLIFILFTVSTQVYGEACTYDEAILALRNGNAVRAHALLKMAARDGDARAQRMVTVLQIPDASDSDSVKNNRASQAQIASSSRQLMNTE